MAGVIKQGMKPLSTLFDNTPESGTKLTDKERDSEIDDLMVGYEKQIKEMKKNYEA